MRSIPVVAAVVLQVVLAASSTARAQVVINEVMYRPYGQTNGAHEFVELYNLTSSDIDLGGWIFTDDDHLTSICNDYAPDITEGVFVFPSPTVIRAKSFLTLWRSAIPGVTDRPDNLVYDHFEFFGNLILSDAGDTVYVLVCGQYGPTVVDSLSYHPAALGIPQTPQNVSLERIIADAPTQDRDNWGFTLVDPGINTGGYIAGGTPGAPNSNFGCSNPTKPLNTPCHDDGVWCTRDVCNGAGACVHILGTGNCFIGDTCDWAGTGNPAGCTCYDSGDLNPQNECESCMPVFPYAWKPYARQGMSCIGDYACGEGNVCDAGQCVAGAPAASGTVCRALTDPYCELAARCDGESRVCPPNQPRPAGTPCAGGNPCFDTCDGAGVCLHAQRPDGAACDDGNVCNGLATCVQGSCIAGSQATDGIACEQGVCSGAACCARPWRP